MSVVRSSKAPKAASKTKGSAKGKKNPKNLFKRGKSPIWHYEFMIGRERIRGCTDTAVERDAVRIVRDLKDAERVRAKAEGGPSPRGARARRGSMTLQQAFERMMGDRPLKGKPKATRDRKADVVCAQLGAGTPITRIDDDAVSRMFGRLRGTHAWGNPKMPLLSNAYINDHIEVLEGAFRAARRAKVRIPDEPEWSIYKLPVKPRTRELTAEEQLRIEEGMREDMRPALLFLVETALRRTDGVELKWSQVDWIDGIIRLEVKGEKTAELPITEEVAAILFEQIDLASERDPNAVFTFVFKGQPGKNKNGLTYERGKRYPLTSNFFYRTFKKTCEAVGVIDARPHDLRKTTGSQTLRATGNIVAVQQRLHHADIKTTREAYSHVTTEDVARAMQTTSVFMAWKRSLAIEARRQRAEGGLRVGLLGSAAAWGFSRSRREGPHGGQADIPGSKDTCSSAYATRPLFGTEIELIPHDVRMEDLSHCDNDENRPTRTIHRVPGNEIAVRFNAQKGTEQNRNSRNFPAEKPGSFSVLLGRDLKTPVAFADAFSRVMRSQTIARHVRELFEQSGERASPDVVTPQLSPPR